MKTYKHQLLDFQDTYSVISGVQTYIFCNRESTGTTKHSLYNCHHRFSKWPPCKSCIFQYYVFICHFSCNYLFWKLQLGVCYYIYCILRQRMYCQVCEIVWMPFWILKVAALKSNTYYSSTSKPHTRPILTASIRYVTQV